MLNHLVSCARRRIFCRVHFTEALIFFSFAVLIFGLSAAKAATNMMPISLTGWNADVVIEAAAAGPPFNSYASEVNAGEGNAYYQTGLPQYAWGMPPSGTLASLVGDRTIFQLQPYTANNALVLSPDTGLTNGTLYLTNPATYARLAVLANSANGTNQTGSVTLNFSDGTAVTNTLFAPDWMNGTVNVAWFGPGRVNLSSGADTTGPENPCFYQTTINVLALTGGTNKTLRSLTFGKAQANSTLIYAVSGLLAGSTPPGGTPVAVTGWNRDIMIENTASGPPYGNYALEFNPTEGTAFYQSGLPGTTYGLPRNGAFASAVDSTLFQLQPYTASNALVMSSETGIAQGTLTLVAPAIYNSIDILANSAGGGGTPMATIYFSDGTSLTNAFNAQDWFLGSPETALQGFDRIVMQSGVTQGGPVNPQFYQTTVDLVERLGAGNKPISSITFNQAAGAGATGIYALSGVLANQTNGNYSLPVASMDAASGISPRSATLTGTVTATGGAAPEIIIYYGTADGGTNASAWAASEFLGFQSGNYSLPLAGLSVNTTYYYRAIAINPAGASWSASSQSFVTASASDPAVTNIPAFNVGAVSAILSGMVTSTGGDAPAVTLYYGLSNGGTTAGSWANSFTLPGVQSGVFAEAVAGLAPNTTYYFTAQASNAAGTVWGSPVQSFTTASNAISQTNLFAVLTGRDDNARTGQNTNETILTPANVNSNSFGKLFSYGLDGYMMAQPLILPNVNIPGKGVHNLVIAATEHDSVYAFDADSNAGPNAQPLWHTSFIDPAAGISPLQSAIDLQASTSPSFYGPEVGIPGTPAIDAVTGTVYVVAKTKEISGGTSNFVHRLHALDVSTGAEKFGGPVVIDGTVFGVGDGLSPLDTVPFSSYKHMNRPALLLQNGVLTVTFTSHQDFPPYHGWVFTYNAYTLQQTGVYNTTPNGSAGGLWQASSGPAADANGNIYFETGNGTFDADNQNYGDSVVKLSTAGGGLDFVDYFTPYNQLMLNLQDLDIGSAGLMLLPDSAGSAAHPHLLVAGSKSGVFWLLDRDNLGQFNPSGDTQIVQEISGETGGMWVTPAYFNGAIYYSATGDYAKEFAISNGVINTAPLSTSTVKIGYPGSSLMISANGTSNAIVWGMETGANRSGPVVLHAYNATNLANQLYTSSQNLARDNPGLAVKYTMPAIANGKVYVGTANYLSVFGNISFLPPPVFSPAAGVFTNSVTVSLSASNTTSIYYTLDGSVPTTNSAHYTAPLVISNTMTVQAIAAIAGQINSPVSTARFINSASLSPYESAVVAAGPLGYWPLNETAGSTAFDIAGGHNGTYIGNVTLGQPGIPGEGFGSADYSALFDGASGYVDIPPGPFNITGAVTAMLWVNVPSTPTHFSGMFGHGDASWRTSINGSGQPGAADGAAPDATSASSIVGSGWHLVAYSYTGAAGVTNSGSLYVDGVLVANNTVTTPAGSAMDVWIGGSPDYGTQRLLAGSVANAAIFTRALTQAQIQSIFHASSMALTVPLNISRAAGGNILLTWPQGILLESTNLIGPWTTNSATSPYIVAPTNSQTFFKLSVN